MVALVRYGTARGVATITLDSPANRNALSSALIGQLLDALATADADPAARAIVLTHTGPVFCSGADLKETAANPTRRRPGGSARC
jgi:methylglutaconyl-CoA hydratase